MKSFGLAVMVAAVAFVACSDELPTKDLIAPEAGATLLQSTDSSKASFSVSSSVCLSFQKDLASARAELDQNPGSAELEEAAASLEAMTADVCN